MGFESRSSVFGLDVTNALSSATRWVNKLLGHTDFSPEETLAEAKNIDPRLVPKVPMQSTDIDSNLLVELGKMGMRRGKLVTAESHPELMQAWQTMSGRAGLKKAPQLIIVESDIINAMTVTPQEVVVTTGLLKKLDLRETCAVLGHELAHANSDHKRPRIAASVIFSTLGALAAHTLWHGKSETSVPNGRSPFSHAVDEVITLAIGGAAGGVVGNQISVKPTELQADLKGAAISGDPQGLVSALRKLEAGHKRHPLMDFLSNLQSGYPTTEQRIANLERIAAMMPAVALPATVTVIPAPMTAQPTPQISHIANEERLENVAPQLALN